jgi:hypothetical protein
MSTQKLGLNMHGVTGRMGMNQHLIRSIVAIRQISLLAIERLHPMQAAGRACDNTLEQALDLCDALDPPPRDLKPGDEMLDTCIAPHSSLV